MSINATNEYNNSQKTIDYQNHQQINKLLSYLRRVNNDLEELKADLSIIHNSLKS